MCGKRFTKNYKQILLAKHLDFTILPLLFLFTFFIFFFSLALRELKKYNYSLQGCVFVSRNTKQSPQSATHWKKSTILQFQFLPFSLKVAGADDKNYQMISGHSISDMHIHLMIKFKKYIVAISWKDSKECTEAFNVVKI